MVQGGSATDTRAVSVIVPAYNACSTILPQLEALRRQDFSGPYEVILVDNGSTDGTTAVAEQFGADWPELRIIGAHARKGPSYARNAGALAARHKILLFCDADDIVEPGWAHALTTSAQAHGVAAGRLHMFRETFDGDREDLGDVPSRQSWGASTLSWPGTGNLGIRRDLLFDLGGFDERLRAGEDIDLGMRLGQRGYAAAECDAWILNRRRSTPADDRAQQFLYAKWNIVLQRRYAADFAEAGGAPESFASSLRALLGHVRRIRRVVRGFGFAAWRHWFAARSGKVAGHLAVLAQPDLLQFRRGLPSLSLPSGSTWINDPPTVSVIIPAYNAEGTIREQIEALAAQDYPQPFEVIIANNASSDGTSAVVSEMQSSVGFRLVLCEASARRGPGYARNVAASVAAGELFLFCDADDVVDESWVRQLSATTKETGAAAGYLEKFSDDAGSDAVIEVASARQLWKGVDQLPWPVTACFGVRRSVFEALGGFDESVPSSEDLDFGVRLSQSGVSLGQSDARVRYRLRTNPQAERQQLRTYAMWESFMQRRYAQVLRESGHAPETLVGAIRSLLGHLRRRRQVVVKYGVKAWDTWFLMRWARVKGQFIALTRPILTRKS